MGLGRPRVDVSRLRVKEPKRCIVPLSVDEVARFWASFRTARDLAIVGLMLLQGLRSAEVLALNPADILLSESQLRVRGKGNKLRFSPLAPETVHLLDHYLRLERPDPCSPALFVSLKGPARGTRDDERRIEDDVRGTRNRSPAGGTATPRQPLTVTQPSAPSRWSRGCRCLPALPPGEWGWHPRMTSRLGL
jgi:integrase